MMANRANLRFVIAILALLVFAVIAVAGDDPATVTSVPSLTPIPPADSLMIPDTPAGRLLYSWLKAHNSADADTIEMWMAHAYTDSALVAMNFEAHLRFYVQSSQMFGELLPAPVAIVRNDSLDLTVHLVEKGYETAKELDPLHVVTVEISADPKHPDRLRKGIGLGNLVCAVKEGREDLLKSDSAGEK
jgi:hypothetical protein